ncbi:MAG: winged helix DNA-binding domain-containing protein [Thermoplasmata archaeon]|nr:winged helix DNA-binding domain-containing protein [Thermoplasmata archaeon]
MARAPLAASLQSVRRLAVTKQHLQGKLPSRVTTEKILSVVRDLAYVQWDPVGIVAPSHQLSLWARLGQFQPAQLERLLWEEKKLLEHWTPIASLVLAEDFPMYHALMSRYPASFSGSWGAQGAQARKFLAENTPLQRRMLDALRERPLQLGEFADHLRTKRKAGEWGFGSDVSQMLFHLQMSGKVMVVGHQGNQNLWGLSDRFLPSWVESGGLSWAEFEREAAQRAIRALGTASPGEIHYYFVRGRYRHLERTLKGLQEDGSIHRVCVEEFGAKDERYIHDRDLPLLDAVDSKTWQSRMSLLPPFDNMVINQARAKWIFGFDYVREQFLPREKRKFGTYVLPILWGDRFIGRIDPRLDRTSGVLAIQAVHAEAGAPMDRETAHEIRATIALLAGFLGVRRVTYTSRVPEGWKGGLH